MSRILRKVLPVQSAGNSISVDVLFCIIAESVGGGRVGGGTLPVSPTDTLYALALK